MPRERDIETETIRAPGVLVKIGQHKLTVPVATIATATLAALGTAYQVVSNDRAAAWAAIHALQDQNVNMGQKLELEKVVLAEIRTQLVRIDARVAEVQVTLMRGGR